MAYMSPTALVGCFEQTLRLRYFFTMLPRFPRFHLEHVAFCGPYLFSMHGMLTVILVGIGVFMGICVRTSRSLRVRLARLEVTKHPGVLGDRGIYV